MKKCYLIHLLQLLLLSSLSAQTWVDTIYSIQTELDIPYGESIDFAGNSRQLLMDVSFPVNDTVPMCGRPLLLAVHGGAFIGGSKENASIQRIREDFARRGYTTAAVNYRLGMFQTHQEVNCNISNLGAEWNCLNMADSSEWYRAYYRSIQDVNGAIRYLINRSEEYQIDPQNVYVVGISAGAFTAMGVGFMEDSTEVDIALTGELPDVLAPNSIYEAACVQGYGLDTSIASMDLSRPDLGGHLGMLNWPLAQEYRIRGVASFYGGIFNNIFPVKREAPALYQFHQPNDLIVPYNYGKVFGGYAHCATQFPFNCASIINRPFIYGSRGIELLLEEQAQNGMEIPDLQFESTSNNANCAIQLINPSLQGHAIDNFWLRTGNIAVFFAEKIMDCLDVNVVEQVPPQDFRLYPNPTTTGQMLHLQGDFLPETKIYFSSLDGQRLYQTSIQHKTTNVSFNLAQLAVSEGVYIVSVITAKSTVSKKIVVMN